MQRTISLWAKRNPWPARFALTALHVTLLVVAYMLTGLLEMQTRWSWVLGLAALASFVGYFILSREWSSRCRHMLIAAASFVLSLFFFQSGGTLQHALAFGYPLQQVNASKPAADIPVFNKKKKIKLFKFLRKPATDKTGRTILTIVTIIIAAGLLFLVAAASCSLSCSGAGAMALLVGIGGLALVLLGMVAVLRRIRRGPKRTEPEEIKDEE